MNKIADRSIIRVVKPGEVLEGAGVLVRRAIPSDEVAYEEVDPFLLLDDASLPTTDSPGFPKHPHRGFEIITYLLSGAAGHVDDAGNKTVVRGGGLQKITTGRGIWHEEMPMPGNREPTRGLQMWINLAQKDKKVRPDYQLLEPQQVTVRKQGEASIRVLVGEGSPIRLHTPATYLDVTVSGGGTFDGDIPVGYQGFIYVLNGRGKFGTSSVEAGDRQFLVLGPGGRLSVVALSAPLRFMLGAGQPHREPIRWSGPFVD